ncbi:MAG: hypothetical protein H7833_19985, partial [Magnetococcus sp. DMHC-1]
FLRLAAIIYSLTKRWNCRISTEAKHESVSLENVIAAAQSLDATVLLAAWPELGSSVPGDLDVLALKIRDVWKQLDSKVKVRRGQAVVDAAGQQGGNETDDVIYISILSEIIPGNKLVSLSPGQWEAQKVQLLQDSQGQRTLFLFDRDFSGAGGDSEGGIEIIKSLLKTDDAESLICGLLTHTVTPETQPKQWEELSERFGISRDRFVVIPKLHLSQAPMLFAQTLKFVALSPDFAKLKIKTEEIIKGAAREAAERVKGVSIYDLDHIVFQVSTEEGLWEPDMLFRLHAMFHRQASLRLAHDGGVLESIAEKLRAVSGIPTECDKLPTHQSAWKLQREELYESDDYINNNYLPLELGDIFQQTDGKSTKKYILLAQPCDLMVRRNGKRTPELERVPLAEIVPETSETKTNSSKSYMEEMPYFDDLYSKKWFVKLKVVHYVRSCILDLCVFNQDGTSRLGIGGNAPSAIRPTWKARHAFLLKYWTKVVRRADDLLAPSSNELSAVKQAKEKIAKNLNDLIFNDDLFKGTLSPTENGKCSITYNCKRVGRLSRARAIGFLMSYTGTLGRPAYDRDFG